MTNIVQKVVLSSGAYDDIYSKYLIHLELPKRAAISFLEGYLNIMVFGIGLSFMLLVIFFLCINVIEAELNIDLSLVQEKRVHPFFFFFIGMIWFFCLQYFIMWIYSHNKDIAKCSFSLNEHFSNIETIWLIQMFLLFFFLISVLMVERYVPQLIQSYKTYETLYALLMCLYLYMCLLVAYYLIYWCYGNFTLVWVEELRKQEILELQALVNADIEHRLWEYKLDLFYHHPSPLRLGWYVIYYATAFANGVTYLGRAYCDNTPVAWWFKIGYTIELLPCTASWTFDLLYNWFHPTHDAESLARSVESHYERCVQMDHVPARPPIPGLYHVILKL